MLYTLGFDTTQIFTDALRKFWGNSSLYRDTLPPNIQNKFSFDQRPNLGMVVSAGGESPVRLSPDNFKGTLQSYLMLSGVRGRTTYPGNFISYVMEDAIAIQQNGGVFPTPAGTYYLRCRKVDNQHEITAFPHLLRSGVMSQVSSTVWRVPTGKFDAGSLRIQLMPGAQYLPVADLNPDPANGTVTLGFELRPTQYLECEYKEEAPSIGPVVAFPETALNSLLRGVVLGIDWDMGEDDDYCALTVSRRRDNHMNEYGGRYSLTVEIDVFTQDRHETARLADRTLVYIDQVLRQTLPDLGVTINNVSGGGTSEEPYDENEDTYFFNQMITVEVETEWSYWTPNEITLRSITSLTAEQRSQLAQGEEIYLDGMVMSLTERNGVFGLTQYGFPTIR